MSRHARGIAVRAAIIVLGSALSGCAGMAEGITRALLADDEPAADTRQCHIRGPAFDGLAGLLDSQRDTLAGEDGSRDLKVIMVHGIGSHMPGYSTRLQENLARTLGLSVVSERPKDLHLQQSQLFPGEHLGVLRVTRFSSPDDEETMTFFEITWSPIADPDKRAIAYDSSGEYSFRRASINSMMKDFVNTHLPDPLIYLGEPREKIQVSVTQGFCWAIGSNWEDLPDGAELNCPLSSLTARNLEEDDYIFVSHSLGSRIVSDSLQRMAEVTERGADDSRYQGHTLNPDFLAAMRQEEFTAFMFANQLALLQLGRKEPPVVNEIAAYCSDDGPRRDERLLKRLGIVAFSDPNDILSWAVPPDYAHQQMDSRLCPTLSNVILGIAPVQSVLGAAELANPALAHGGYDNDDRVMAIIAGGVGTPATLPVVEERCEWLETR